MVYDLYSELCKMHLYKQYLYGSPDFDGCLKFPQRNDWLRTTCWAWFRRRLTAYYSFRFYPVWRRLTNAWFTVPQSFTGVTFLSQFFTSSVCRTSDWFRQPPCWNVTFRVHKSLCTKGYRNKQSPMDENSVSHRQSRVSKRWTNFGGRRQPTVS